MTAGTDPWLVALDIDGTLVPEATADVSIETRAAVTAVRESGHEVVLATGRSLVGVVPVARALGLHDTWTVCSNGAVTARLDPTLAGGYEVTDALTFDAGPVAGLAWSLLTDIEIAAEETGVGYAVTSDFGPALNGTQNVVGLGELGRRRTARLALRARGAAATLLDPIRSLGVTANPAGPDWVDVTPARTSKAAALEIVRRRLGVAPTRVLALGDSHNDLPMFEWAARSVAMGGAPDVVRAAADETTGTLEEDGAATVLRRFLTVAAAEPVTS